MWKEWVIDLTLGTDPLPCFVPYERDTDEFIVGMNMLTDRCPGELIGVIHSDGQEAVEKWCAANPDWHERYKRHGGDERDA